MSKKVILLGLALLVVSANSVGDGYKKSPGSATAYEVRFLSVDLRSNGFGTVVARPCDESAGCDLLYARIDTKTHVTRNGQVLSRRESRQLKWHSGVLAINKRGTAVSIKLFGGRR